MPDKILEAVAIRRPLITGVAIRDDIDKAIAKFANAQLYRNPQRAERMGQEIIRLYQNQYRGFAQAIGKASAKPILDALGGSELVAKGNVLRGRVLNRRQRFSRANMLALRAALRREVGTLSAEVEVEFIKGFRDGQTRNSIINNLVAADKDELKRLRDISHEISRNGEALAKAEKRLSKASVRGKPRARRELSKAKKDLSKSKAKIGATQTFLARFEQKVQAEMRDSIRREAEDAQFSHYEQAGFKEFTWIAVNGSDACPSCVDRHGMQKNVKNWRGDRPGEADTFCGDACMCALVPTKHTEGNVGLAKPLFRGDAN